MCLAVCQSKKKIVIIEKILFDILNVLDWRLDLVIILCLMKIMYLIFLKIEDVFCQIMLRGSDAVFANRTDNRKVREYSQTQQQEQVLLPNV